MRSLLLMLALVLPASAVENPAPFPMVLARHNTDLTLLFSKTGQAFLSGADIDIADASIKDLNKPLLPFEPQRDKQPGVTPGLDGAKAAQGELQHLREQAASIQKGRDPQTAKEIFHASITLMCEKLRLGQGGAPKAIALYGERVRSGGGAGGGSRGKAELLLEAETVQRMMQKKNLTPEQTSALTTRAGEYAKALGGLIFIDAEGNSMIVGQQSKGPLTQAELERMAGMPRFQLPSNFKGFGTAPPFPVFNVPKHAPRLGEAGHELGWASSAYKYWDDMEKRQGDMVSDGKRGVLAATFVATGATVMKGFYHMSGFGAVEQSTRQLNWDLDRGAHGGTVAWSATKLGGNALLSALNFVPGVTAIKGMATGGTVLRTAKAGTPIIELAGGVGRESAGIVASELRTVVTTTAGEGGKIVTGQARTLLTNLGQTTKKYGITIVEDRSLLGMGSATGDASTIVINTRMGAAHEVTHAFQQAQIRMSILQRMGKPYEALSVVEKADFARQVTAMETVAYNTFEKGAFGATGFMGSGSLSTGRYAAGLEANIAGFEAGIANGVVPNIKLAASLRPGAAIYTELPNWLGQSQTAISMNLGATISLSRPLYPYIDQGVGNVMQSGMDLFMGDPMNTPPMKTPATRPNGS